MSLSRVAVFPGDFICPNLMNLKNPCPSVSMSIVLGTLPLMLRAWLARRVRNGSNFLTSHYLITGSQPGMSYAAAVSSSPPPETSKSPPVIPHKNSVSHSSSANDHFCNIVLFGLPGGRSLVESKRLWMKFLNSFLVNPFKAKICFVWVNLFLKLLLPFVLVLC